MKHVLITLLFFITLFSTSETLVAPVANAQSFQPTVVETNQFKFWAGYGYRTRDQEHLTTCRFLTRLSDDQTAIEIKMGVLNSDFDYFGTDLSIPLSDFPLKQNYYKEFIVIGASSMYLTYKENKLEFKFLKKYGLWSLIYPFSLEIDPLLLQPKKLSAKMQGYDKDILGFPKTHVTEECLF